MRNRFGKQRATVEQWETQMKMNKEIVALLGEIRDAAKHSLAQREPAVMLRMIAERIDANVAEREIFKLRKE